MARRGGVGGVGGVALAIALAVVVAALALGGAHAAHSAHSGQAEGQHAVVQRWAKRLGDELRYFANNVTRYQRLHESFSGARVAARNATAILRGVALGVEKLMQRRMAQVQDIRRAAEKLGASTDWHKLEVPQPYLGVKDMETTEPPATAPSTTPGVPFWRRGRTTVPVSTTPRPTIPTTTLKPWLTRVESFPGASLVNETLSAVHVPATVYDGRFMNLTDGDNDAEEMNSTGAEVQQVIELTSKLDAVFVRNIRKDPTTSWQFFAHQTGVMRQFPASKWNTFYQKDYFDARVRPWYLGAATSPKDMVILLDNSGSISMTEPSMLTKLVVHNLLDTLGPDDFVSVLLFNEKVEPLVPGLNETLIPATSAYVRELQHALVNLEPKGMCKLGNALEAAFVLLEKYRREDLGTGCNQAVMLVTDLVPEHEEELFRTHNRPELDNPSHTHARVFTFIVGDWAQGPPREAQWMACANKGWHMNIWKYQQDGVIEYIPVMARPVVLNGAHPVHWSHMYADVTVPGVTDLLWAEMERDEQLRKIAPFCFRHAELHPPDKKHLLRSIPKEAFERDLGQNEEFVVTVSVPVRDLSMGGIDDGILLGVAGIDVPVKQITRMIPHYKVGVNAYIFMVTNNGLVVFHPELRPRFNGILKPGFNSIDMAEVEQEDTPHPRNMSKSMQEFRDLVINQTTGSVVLTIRQTYDNFFRVSRWNRRYYFRGVADTPYSLVMAVPEEYGGHRVQPSADAVVSYEKIMSSLRGSGASGLGGRGGPPWGTTGGTVHPNWTYCSCNCRRQGESGLRMINQACGPDTDRELAAALSHDVEATRWWASDQIKDRSYWERWEVSATFMATHSGLTRWLIPPRNTLPRDDTAAPVGTRGPDEVWYRRAVESAAATASGESAQSAHWVVSVPLVDEPGSDVYSEYNAAYDQDDPWAARRAGLADDWSGYPRPNLTLSEKVAEVGDKDVIATAAVNRRRAPAAVAGLRFPQAKLQELFDSITTTLMCPERGSCLGANTCLSEDLHCFLLDEHGIVVADETGTEAGRPLARVFPDLMARLERARVFQRISAHDYQGVCRRVPGKSAVAPVRPTRACWAGTGAALATLWWQQQQQHGHGLAGLAQGVAPAAALLLGGAQLVLGAKLKDASTTPEYKLMLRNALEPVRVKKTVLQLCNMKMDRHRVGPGLHQHHHPPLSSLSCEPGSPGSRSFAAAAVPGTNLVLVTALKSCPKQEQLYPFSSEPWEDTGDVEGDGPVLRKLWPRRRPTTCHNRHPDERNITRCNAAPRSRNFPAPLGTLFAIAALTMALPTLLTSGDGVVSRL